MTSNQDDRMDQGEIRHWLTAVHELPAVRQEKVERVREALRNQSYENEQMLDETIERLNRDEGLTI